MLLDFSRIVGLVCMSLILSACAVSNTFVSYSSRSAVYKSAIDHGAEEKVLAELNRKRESADKQLYLAERARVAHLAGMIEESIFDFSGVLDAIAIEDEKAKIAVSRMGAKASSVLTNDSVIPYSMDSYEKILVHHYQALNFIARGDIGSAGVEIRRANFLQSEALEMHAKELARVEEAAREKSISVADMRLDEKLASMSDAVGQVKNSFQNAYTFYLSGLVYESLGSYNDAYIDYRKALEINPKNRYIQNDVLRLAKKLGMREDFNLFKEQFDREPLPSEKGSGAVVVLYEQGYVPPKIEYRLDLPNFSNGGFVSVAIPFYDFRWAPPVPASVRVDGEVVGATAMVLDVSALAAKALREEMPKLALRQVVRAVAKSSMQKKAQKENPYAGLAMTILNMATERADLRAWSTLPSSVQILRQNVPEGKHRVSVTTNGLTTNVDVDVRAGKTAMVYLTNTGPRQISRVYNL